MEGGQQYNPRTVEEVFRDFKSRRAGMIKALTTDVEEFYQQCDPEKENLCLYGFPNERWEVNLPAEEVPPELPEPALGINFARDGMQEKDWLSLVAVHSDAWLLAVAFYFGARFGFDKADRKRLFNMINDLPTIFEVATGAAKKQSKEKSAVSNHSSSKPKSNPKQRGSESQAKFPKVSQPKDDDEDEEGLEDEEVQVKPSPTVSSIHRPPHCSPVVGTERGMSSGLTASSQSPLVLSSSLGNPKRVPTIYPTQVNYPSCSRILAGAGGLKVTGGKAIGTRRVGSSFRCLSALTPELKTTLDKVVTSQKVVLFMKGTKDFPQCGFSNNVVQILKSLNVPFETINILENEILRQGLKEYSSWPTFPQLYIDGEFFGGCDITIEAYKSGELQELLEKALLS